MADVSPVVCEPIRPPDHPATAIVPVRTSPTADELDILNDDVLIEVAPDRPCGTIRVKLVHTGQEHSHPDR